MERWIGKTAVVTGASVGIGKAIATSLVKSGLIVVGLARRIDKMEQMARDLKNEKGTFYPKQCDVTNEESIIDAFKYADTLGGADILVNNAGVVFEETILDGSTNNYKNILDVNLLAAVICTREAAKSMRRRKVEGQIINMSSVVGYNATRTTQPLSLYQSSKHGLTALSEVVRNEIAAIKAPIKVTNLSPGLVKTDMIDNLVAADGVFHALPHLETKDVADAVLSILGTPPNVQIEELRIAAIHEVYLNAVC